MNYFVHTVISSEYDSEESILANMMVKTISKQTQTNDSKRKVTYIGPVDEESDTWSNNEDDQQESGEMLYFDKYNTVRIFIVFK